MVITNTKMVETRKINVAKICFWRKSVLKTEI